MAEFTRGARSPSIYLPIENDTGAQPFRNENQDEIAGFAHLGRTKPQFGKRGRVGVVIDRDRVSGSRSNPALDINIAPVEIRNIKSLTAQRVDQSRQTNTHTFNTGWRLAGQFNYSFDRPAQSLFQVGMGTKLFRTEHTSGDVAAGDRRVYRRNVYANGCRMPTRQPQ